MKRFFDLDGTLFWSAEYIKFAYEDAYLRSGLEIPFFRKKIKNLYSLSLKSYLKFLDVDEILINDYSSILSKIKNESFSRFSSLLVPNHYLIDELIKNQSSSYIVSNASFKTAINYLNFFKIKFPAEQIYTREKLIATKPSKLAYLTLMNFFQENEEFVVYEDSDDGIISAKEAGIRNILRVSYNKKEKIWDVNKYD